jgi:hypothetical protein
MLLEFNEHKLIPRKLQSERLKSFGLNERDLQAVMFRCLDRLLPSEELLVVMQSRQWQEEPDIMGLDASGKLYIFELKAWESTSENLLQVLRYGQIYGLYNYNELARLYERVVKGRESLVEAHQKRFGIALSEEQFNQDQVFVVMTNGVDVKTREAVQYWHNKGIKVRPWIYRIYAGDAEKRLLEIIPFRVEDDPYEDLAEEAAYYILNTNSADGPRDDADMLKAKKAAAYFGDWKFKIDRLKRGNTVFLFRNGKGIVAVGKASGQLKKADYHGEQKYRDEEHYMHLDDFSLVDPPLTAAEIKEITRVNYRFMATMFGIDPESGEKLYKHATKRLKNTQDKQ